MSFVLHALLPPEAPASSLDAFKARLDSWFAKSKGFKSCYEQAPIINERGLRAEWGGWSIAFYYNEGQEVIDDCREIKRRLGEAAPHGLELINRRIYAMFADDPNREHTTPTIEVTQLLTELPGAIVYNPNANGILKPS